MSGEGQKKTDKGVWIFLFVAISGTFLALGIKSCSENLANKAASETYKRDQKQKEDKLEAFKFEDSLADAEIVWYFNESKSNGVKSPDHKKLVLKYCELNADEFEKVITTALDDKQLLNLPGVSVANEVRICFQEDNAKYSDLSKKLEKAELTMEKRRIANEKANAKLKEEMTAAARKDYGLRLREIFLDKGTDIKVTVSGKNSTEMTLKFVLFNDVWSHNFQKTPMIDQIKEQGFKKLRMTDGYDWGCSWDFTE